MKKVCTTLVAIFSLLQFSYAQWTSDPPYLYSTTNNLVGIGTTTPLSKLDIKGGVAVGSFAGLYAAPSNGIIVSGNVGLGTTSPAYKLDIIGSLRIATSTGASYTERDNSILFNRTDLRTTYTNKISNSMSGTVGHNTMSFEVSDGTGTGTATIMTLVGTGYVGIGTPSPKETLSVNGNIRAKQVKVETINWPDYVFKPTYNLPLLKDIKVYIKQNNHLPDMPSEADVIKDGLNLGEIVKIQTKKIEELTLYLIEKDKQIEDQQKNNKAQQDQIDQLKEQLNALTRQISK